MGEEEEKISSSSLSRHVSPLHLASAPLPCLALPHLPHRLASPHPPVVSPLLLLPSPPCRPASPPALCLVSLPFRPGYPPCPRLISPPPPHRLLSPPCHRCRLSTAVVSPPLLPPPGLLNPSGCPLDPAPQLGLALVKSLLPLLNSSRWRCIAWSRTLVLSLGLG